MDKSSDLSSESSTSSNRDQYLKHVNKISHKISKPTTTIIRKPTFDHHPPVPPPPPPQQQTQSQPHNLQQHQPPVYNISKSDFRDVVQKLTGSPSHERFSTPPPIQPPKAQSSRLQRIRPPPLAQISNRPPPLLNSAVAPNPTTNSHFINSQRQVTRPALSPLPPFPAVHGAAESPISAYMRYLHNSISTADSDSKRFSAALSPFVSPRWNNFAPSQHSLPPPTSSASMAQLQFPTMPSSPLPFGCSLSPRSPHPLLSPNMLFSPTTMGQLGFQNHFPVSPRLAVPSPRWKDV